MSEPTEIEKKSLEAHVELCAERYSSLDTRLNNMNEKIGKVEAVVHEIHQIIKYFHQCSTIFIMTIWYFFL